MKREHIRELLVEDLNPHIPVLLDMVEEQKKQDANEEEAPSLLDSQDGGDSHETQQNESASQSLPPTPGEIVDKVTEAVLHSNEREASIFDRLKAFNPDNVKGAPPKLKPKQNLTSSAKPSESHQEDEDELFQDRDMSSISVPGSDQISRSPADASSELDELAHKLGIQDEPLGSTELSPEAPPRRTVASRTSRTGKGAEKVGTAILDDNSPEAEMLRLLQDIGVTRGKVYITNQFFKRDGGNNPSWLNTVMAEAGCSPNKRRMAIIGWFGDTPERLGVNTNKVGTRGESNTVDEVIGEIEEDQANEVKRLANQKKLEDLKETLGMPGRGRRKPVDDDDEDLIEVPVKEPDGSFSKDAKGNPIVMKMTKKQFFWLKQEEASLARSKGQNGGSGEDSMMMKFMQQTHEREIASQERFNKLIEEMRTNRSDSEKQLLGYILQRERADKTQLQQSIRTDTDILSGLDQKLGIYETLGLVSRDREKPSDTQTKLVRESREAFKDGYSSVKGDVMQIATWFREDLKEERRTKNPELVNDSRVPPRDKEEFYRRIAAEIATSSGQDTTPPADSKQSTPATPAPPDILTELANVRPPSTEKKNVSP